MLKCGYDIISMLQDRGLSKWDAIYVLSNIDNDQIPYLINSLLSHNSESEDELRGILYQYGIDLEDEYYNCEILDGNDKFFKSYGFNVKTEYQDFLEDMFEEKSIPYTISNTNIYFYVPDDATLYMIDNFISEGKKKMTKYTNISTKRIDEKAIGFSNSIERRRLAQLAGIKEDFNFSDEGDIETANPNVDMGDVSADAIGAPEIATDVSVPPIVDQDTVVPVSNSEAMNFILDSLNSIQAQLPDVRLSEYKTLVIKVNDLASQVKAMGGSYLSERRMKGH